MKMIFRTRVSSRMELARFSAAIGSASKVSCPCGLGCGRPRRVQRRGAEFLAAEMACADMASGSRVNASLSSDERTVLGPPEGLRVIAISGVLPPARPKTHRWPYALPACDRLREEKGGRRPDPRRARRRVRRHRHEPAV